jgi:hypothetical protein
MKRRPLGRKASKKVFRRGNRVNPKNRLDTSSTAAGLWRGGIRF